MFSLSSSYHFSFSLSLSAAIRAFLSHPLSAHIHTIKCCTFYKLLIRDKNGKSFVIYECLCFTYSKISSSWLFAKIALASVVNPPHRTTCTVCIYWRAFTYSHIWLVYWPSMLPILLVVLKFYAGNLSAWFNRLMIFCCCYCLKFWMREIVAFLIVIPLSLGLLYFISVSLTRTLTKKGQSFESTTCKM